MNEQSSIILSELFMKLQIVCGQCPPEHLSSCLPGQTTSVNIQAKQYSVDQFIREIVQSWDLSWAGIGQSFSQGVGYVDVLSVPIPSTMRWTIETLFNFGIGSRTSISFCTNNSASNSAKVEQQYQSLSGCPMVQVILDALKHYVTQLCEPSVQMQTPVMAFNFPPSLQRRLSLNQRDQKNWTYLFLVALALGKAKQDELLVEFESWEAEQKQRTNELEMNASIRSFRMPHALRVKCDKLEAAATSLLISIYEPICGLIQSLHSNFGRPGVQVDLGQFFTIEDLRVNTEELLFRSLKALLHHSLVVIEHAPQVLKRDKYFGFGSKFLLGSALALNERAIPKCPNVRKFLNFERNMHIYLVRESELNNFDFRSNESSDFPFTSNHEKPTWPKMVNLDQGSKRMQSMPDESDDQVEGTQRTKAKGKKKKKSENSDSSEHKSKIGISWKAQDFSVVGENWMETDQGVSVFSELRTYRKSTLQRENDDNGDPPRWFIMAEILANPILASSQRLHIRALSAPIYLSVSCAQQANFEGLMLWNNAFKNSKEPVPWQLLGEILSRVFEVQTKRALDQREMKYLQDRMRYVIQEQTKKKKDKRVKNDLNISTSQPLSGSDWFLVSRDNFLKDPLGYQKKKEKDSIKEVPFSFWDWLFGIKKIILELPLLAKWWQDKHLLGFITREEATDMLNAEFMRLDNQALDRLWANNMGQPKSPGERSMTLESKMHGASLIRFCESYTNSISVCAIEASAEESYLRARVALRQNIHNAQLGQFGQFTQFNAGVNTVGLESSWLYPQVQIVGPWKISKDNVNQNALIDKLNNMAINNKLLGNTDYIMLPSREHLASALEKNSKLKDQDLEPCNYQPEIIKTSRNMEVGSPPSTPGLSILSGDTTEPPLPSPQEQRFLFGQQQFPPTPNNLFTHQKPSLSLERSMETNSKMRTNPNEQLPFPLQHFVPFGASFQSPQNVIGNPCPKHMRVHEIDRSLCMPFTQHQHMSHRQENSMSFSHISEMLPPISSVTNESNVSIIPNYGRTLHFSGDPFPPAMGGVSQIQTPRTSGENFGSVFK